MPNPELEKYIATSRENKITDEAIKSQLVESGWNENDVTAALTPTSSDVPNIPPPPVPQFGMWVAFQYVILFISLYISASALAGVLHIGVDTSIPDALSTSSGYDYSTGINDFLIKAYLACLIVGFPIFAALFIILKRQMLHIPAVRNLRARKTLIYLTLIGTFLLMIGHLIMTIFGFLSGSVTTRSIAHFGVTLLVAGSIFVYLLLEVREDRKVK